MSAPRLVLCGLEPSPAVALAAGALLACLGDDRDVRPVALGLDLPLWRLLCRAGARAPRALDQAMVDDRVAGELYDSWSAGCDLALVVAAEPALDRWQDVKGSRPVDVAAGLDAPLVLVVDARDRGPTAAAAVCGVRSLTRSLEIAGVIVVGGDERGAAAELGELIRRTTDLPVLGWIPPQLSEQFVRQYDVTPGPLRQIGPRPVEGGELRLCTEAATYLQGDELLAAASRRGFLPSPARRVLAPLPAAAGLRLAVGWGGPLEPFGLEAIDVLKAAGLELMPFDLAADTALPEDVAGLFLCGLLDEARLVEFAANEPLRASLAAAIGGGLPTLAFGGGALLLLNRLADTRGRSHELAGVVPAEAELLEWYHHPHYVRARAARENAYDEGARTLYELFDLEFLVLEQESFAYHVGGENDEGEAEGFALGRCLATTLVPSLPGDPSLTAAFVDAMRLSGLGA